MLKNFVTLIKSHQHIIANSYETTCACTSIARSGAQATYNNLALQC